MKTAIGLVAIANALLLAAGATLDQLCTPQHVQQSLPAIANVTYDSSSITATAMRGLNIPANQADYPARNNVNYCDVRVTYSHNPSSNDYDRIHLHFNLPDPSQFANRFVATGGRGTRLNASDTELRVGLAYGAVAGQTDGGYGTLGVDQILRKSDGTLDMSLLARFAYLDTHEMTTIGKGLTARFYSTSSRVYSYYTGCSEGGRQGLAQVQTYNNQFDGAAIGAPAFSQAYITPDHIFPQVYEKIHGYTPTRCELLQIHDDTVAACDGLDGKVDGLVGRSDLCKLRYNATASIGKSFSCAAPTGSSPVWAFGSSSTGTVPAESGTVTAQGVAVYQAMIDGVYDSANNHIFPGYLPGANSKYNGGASYVNGQKSLVATGIGAQWVKLYLNNQSAGVDTILSLDNVNSDTLKTWIQQGLARYGNLLQNTNPNIGGVRDAGSKILHFHGEADSSVPTLISTLYFESVRKALYGSMSYQDSINALNQFYRFYLVPGSQHCTPDAANTAYPNSIVGALIDWVEHGVTPVTLNGTVLSGANAGTQQNLCSFPLRPQWSNGAQNPTCVFPDQNALNVFQPALASV